MTNLKEPNYSKEDQTILYSYFDTVWIDFDMLSELKKVKGQVKKRSKKPGNK